MQLYHDPRYEQDLVVFVDARNDDHYQAGHVPGAHLFDYYRPANYLSNVLQACQIAQEIVVYCNGGDCEDSELAATMLRDLGIRQPKTPGLWRWHDRVEHQRLAGGNRPPQKRQSSRQAANEPCRRHSQTRILKPATSSWKRITLDIAAVLARWLLGALFIYMGLNKALHPEYFLKLVRQYDVVTNPYLLNCIAAALPWFEVFCGVLLLAGIAVRGSALMLIGMLVPFSLLVLKRALAIAAAQGLAFWVVKFDCGCGNGEVIIWKKLLENGLLFLLSCWLLSGSGRRLCARFSLLK